MDRPCAAPICWMAVAALVAATAVSACSPDTAAPLTCPASVVSALVHADDRPSWPITPAAQAAIGALRTPSGELVCTGTYLGDRWVLTARHCVDAPTFQGLRFETGRDLARLEATAAEYFPHPELDVMLLRIPASAALASLALEPIAPWPLDDPRDWTGVTVTLAGFGDTSDGSDGRRQFLDEPVVSVASDMIVVDGGTEHGACHGDSGGPLLAASPAGAPRIIGVLSAGRAACRGQDRYLASAAFAPWVAEVQARAAADPCGGVPTEGVCEGGLARWCAGGFVEAEACADGRLCGWNAAAAGYRCVASDADPCLGAGPGGDCDGDTARICRQGTLVRMDCGACGQGCDLGPDGHPGCV